MKNKKLNTAFHIISAVTFIYFAVMEIKSPALFSFKVFWFFVSLIFFFLAKIKKTFSRKIKISLLLFLVTGFSVSLINLFFILTPKIDDGKIENEYVIILGGGVRRDGILTDVPNERLSAASVYLKNHKNAVAIVTGGLPKFGSMPESVSLKKKLVSLGIGPERILEENRAHDTIENLIFCAQLISAQENISMEETLQKTVAIVTSRYHLARAERLAKRLGYKNITGLAGRTPLVYIPNDYAREILAYVKLNLRIIFTGEPKKL